MKVVGIKIYRVIVDRLNDRINDRLNSLQNKYEGILVGKPRYNPPNLWF